MYISLSKGEPYNYILDQKGGRSMFSIRCGGNSCTRTIVTLLNYFSIPFKSLDCDESLSLYVHVHQNMIKDIHCAKMHVKGVLSRIAGPEVIKQRILTQALTDYIQGEVLMRAVYFTHNQLTNYLSTDKCR